MRGIDFIRQAVCVDADPKLFGTHDLTKVQPALDYCARCTVTKACEEIVSPPPPAPMSYFNGVSGGIVFFEGEKIAWLDENFVLFVPDEIIPRSSFYTQYGIFDNADSEN